MGFPSGSESSESACNAGDLGLIPGSGRSPSIYIYIYICHIFFIHSSIDGQIGYFCILAIAHNATMNMGLQMSV